MALLVGSVTWFVFFFVLLVRVLVLFVTKWINVNNLFNLFIRSSVHWYLFIHLRCDAMKDARGKL